jgi:hypothetical protein
MNTWKEHLKTSILDTNTSYSESYWALNLLKGICSQAEVAIRYDQTNRERDGREDMS